MRCQSTTGSGTLNAVIYCCRGTRLGYWPKDKHLFPPFGDELIGTLLYLFGGQRSPRQSIASPFASMQ